MTNGNAFPGNYPRQGVHAKRTPYKLRFCPQITQIMDRKQKLRSSCKLAPSSRVGWSPKAKPELDEAALTDVGSRLRPQVRYKKTQDEISGQKIESPSNGSNGNCGRARRETVTKGNAFPGYHPGLGVYAKERLRSIGFILSMNRSNGKWRTRAEKRRG